MEVNGFSCLLFHQLWDLRFEKAVFEAKQNEDYLSDIAVDETNRIVFATRLES